MLIHRGQIEHISEIQLHLIMLDVWGLPHLKLTVNITALQSEWLEIQHTFYEYRGTTYSFTSVKQWTLGRKTQGWHKSNNTWNNDYIKWYSILIWYTGISYWYG